MLVLLRLCYEFFKTGLFSVGGGYVTIPFLYHFAEHYHWYSVGQLVNMISISVITPGPVGVNMATFAGYQVLGILGGILATCFVILPSYLIIVIGLELISDFRQNRVVKSILYSLKPASCGLLMAVCLNFCRTNITSLYAVLLLSLLFIISFKFKRNPLYYFLFASVIGVILQLSGVNFL